MTGHGPDLAPMMHDVAKALLGKPNDRLSRPRDGVFRFGSQGSMEVNTREGWFSDYESDVRGGVLELIKHKGGVKDDAGAFQWLEAKGIKETSGPEDAKPSSTFYDYRDEVGRVVFRVERKQRGNNKTFLQHGPDGNGGFACKTGCMAGVKRILYRLPELVAADPGEPVFYCEGEKDADRLAQLGLVATTHPGGAGKFDAVAECISQHLRGRRVVVLQDNDEAGASHAIAGLAMIGPAAKEVARLALPDLPEKGDVSDWLDLGGSAFELQSLAESALLPIKPDPALPPKITATPYQWRDPETIPLRPWVLGRWLLRRTVAAVVAPGGVGKTTFLASAALSLITGRELLGKTVWDGPQKVWIWNLEDGLEDMERSIQAAAMHHGLRREDVEGQLFVDCAMEGAGLCTAIDGADGFKLLAPVYEQITAEITKRGIDVLVIDPFVSSHEIEENANSLVDKVAKAWARVANDANCVVVLVHHTSKQGAGTVTTHSSRGAVSLTDATRSALVLNRLEEKKAQELGFDEGERKRYFSVGDDKHNRAPAEKADWFYLTSVSLGNGPNGGDSVGVAVPAKLPDPFEDITVDHLRAVQSKVADGQWRENNQASDWVGKAVAEAIGLDLTRVSDKAKVKALLKTWIANGALVVVERKDHRSEVRKFIEVGSPA